RSILLLLSWRLAMRRFLILTPIVAVLAFLPVSGLAQTSETKRKLIAELIEVTGVLNNIEGEFRKGIDEQKRAMDGLLPDDLILSDNLTETEKRERQEKAIAERNRLFDMMIDRVEKEIDFKGFVERSLYKVYDKHYTEQDLSELIAFYRTPIGKKVVAVSPLIESETMNAFVSELMPQMLKIIKEIMEIEMKDLKEKLDNELNEEDEAVSVKDLKL
ncbi:MAG TPA: DUF2059 domain-containing protein, partial [Pyrinomonadaceae bacterium]|nr:DUF2059 domain-containing protein [Pyrinomonadaceae bacterium]